MLDIKEEKEKVTKELQNLQAQLNQIENLRNTIIIEIAKRNGILEFLTRIETEKETGVEN